MAAQIAFDGSIRNGDVPAEVMLVIGNQFWIVHQTKVNKSKDFGHNWLSDVDTPITERQCPATTAPSFLRLLIFVRAAVVYLVTLWDAEACYLIRFTCPLPDTFSQFLWY